VLHLVQQRKCLLNVARLGVRVRHYHVGLHVRVTSSTSRPVPNQPPMQTCIPAACAARNAWTGSCKTRVHGVGRHVRCTYHCVRLDVVQPHVHPEPRERLAVAHAAQRLQHRRAHRHVLPQEGGGTPSRVVRTHGSQYGRRTPNEWGRGLLQGWTATGGPTSTNAASCVVCVLCR
jgi:hypothetical protein